MRKTFQSLSLALLLAATPTVWAGTVAASAGQNTVGTVIDTGPGPTAFAQFGSGLKPAACAAARPCSARRRGAAPSARRL